MEGQGSESLRQDGPSPQPGQDAFACTNREAGFPLLASPSFKITPTVLQHNQGLPYSNLNSSSNLNSDPNSSFVINVVNPNSVTDLNQSSFAIFNAGSPASATPPFQTTVIGSEASSSEARKKKRERPLYVKEEDVFKAVFPKLPTAMSHKKKGPGASKRAQLHTLGLEGQNFTPHVLTVLIGQDICTKIMTFSIQGPWSVCILSASGTVSNAAIQHAGVSGGAVAYEGRFEILSLSGSFLLTEDNVARRTGGLSVSLAGPDGRVIGGVVVGLLMAATPVQVILGTFSTEVSNMAEGEESMSAMKTTARVDAETQPSRPQMNSHDLGQVANGATEQPFRYCVPLPLVQSVPWGGHRFSVDRGAETDHATSEHLRQSL